MLYIIRAGDMAELRSHPSGASKQVCCAMVVEQTTWDVGPQSLTHAPSIPLLTQQLLQAWVHSFPLSPYRLLALSTYIPYHALIATPAELTMASILPLPPNYATALRLIDEAHAQDPRMAEAKGNATVPFELDYAQKMTRWLASRYPEASPALQLACRAQHFRRFVFVLPFPSRVCPLWLLLTCF